MNEEIKPENVRIHSRADELIACLEGEIAKRDETIARLESDNRSKNGSLKAFGEQIAGLQKAVRNRERLVGLRDARILELESQYQRDVFGLNNEGDPIGGDPAGGYANDNARLRSELAAVKAQEPVAYISGCYRDVIGGKSDRTPLGAELAFVNMGWIGQIPLYAAPVSEAKAQGVVMPERLKPSRYEIQDARSDAWNSCLDEVARLNAAPVQQDQAFCEYCGGNDEEPQDHCMDCTRPVRQVSVPDGWRIERRELDGSVCFIIGSPRLLGVRANTSVWESDSDPAHLLLWHMLYAAPAAPAADAGLVEARKANNELVNDLHVMTNKRRQLVDALTYLRECLDPDDYMGEISMHDFIDDALAAHRAQGVV